MVDLTHVSSFTRSVKLSSIIQKKQRESCSALNTKVYWMDRGLGSDRVMDDGCVNMWRIDGWIEL